MIITITDSINAMLADCWSASEESSEFSFEERFENWTRKDKRKKVMQLYGSSYQECVSDNYQDMI